MAKFPEPPDAAELARLRPLTVTLPVGTQFARVFFAGGEHPGGWNRFRHFGPTAARFDHHLPGAGGDLEGSVQERGILYAASGERMIPTCLAEVFQTGRRIDRRARSPALTLFAIVRPLVLLDLTGPFVTAIGASTAIHSGVRPRARRWARRIHEAYPTLDGIHYCSSMYGNAPATALFERAVDALPVRPDMIRALSDPSLSSAVRRTAEHIGYRWL